MFFDSWNDVLRVLVVGCLAYVALVLLLRVSGKRTLSKMNAFDLVVTIALGSTLSSVLLTKDVALVEGIAAFALLIVLQYIVAWLSVRSQVVRQIVKAQPALLFFKGEFLREAMRRERVTEDEIHAAIRGQASASLEAVEAVVLETDGSVTVLKKSGAGALRVLQSVRGYEGRADEAG